MGKYQGRLVADHILGRPVALRSDGALVPRVTFTEPQVAAVGHTLESALAAGLRARAVDVPDRGQRGRLVHRARRAGHRANRRRRGPPRPRRRDVHGRRGRRGAARRDDRGRRRGLPRRPLARRAVVPHAQRAVAQAARGLRALMQASPLPERVAGCALSGSSCSSRRASCSCRPPAPRRGSPSGGAPSRSRSPGRGRARARRSWIGGAPGSLSGTSAPSAGWCSATSGPAAPTACCRAARARGRSRSSRPGRRPRARAATASRCPRAGTGT